jgi:hypothetical protein
MTPRSLALIVGLGLAGLASSSSASPAGAAATKATAITAVVAETGDAGDGSDSFHASADPATIPEGTFIRITADGGVSPFTSVAWDVTVRGATAVVSLVKENLCATGQRERVKLLEGAGARRILATLKDAGAWTCPGPTVATTGRARDHAAPSDQVRYEVWSAWGRRMTRYHLTQSALREAPCALAVITAVTAEVRARLESLPMRDLYYPSDRLGWVTATSSEAATATIDGWDQVRLPVDALEVVEGEHSVVVTGESGRTRQFKIKVAPGMTLRVHVLLEDPDGSPMPVPAH